ncbi:MAG: dienelactone hydrolase family protein [Phenylobacterium sp.]
MCDDDIHQGLVQDPTVSRRAFGLSVAAAGIATTAHAQANVIEEDVAVKTADGTCDAALFSPTAKGSYPAVLMWPDILGLRPVFRDMGRRLAASGYVVLVPNPFYRSKKAPVVEGAFDFNKPEDRAKVMALRAAMTNEGIDRDAAAYLAFLDGRPQVNRKKKAGVQGYCMGGPLSFRTAAVGTGRVGAVGSFHGGGLVGKGPDSPHLLIPNTTAEFYCAVADNDDKAQPEAKDVLRAAFAAAGRPAKVEVYEGCAHGWCVKGSPVYNEAGAERAWSDLLSLYKRALV